MRTARQEGNNLKTNKAIKEYCTGCGLCSAINPNIKLKMNSDGFFRPDCAEKELQSYEKYCLAYGKNNDCYDRDVIWGRFEKVFLGYSTDFNIRHRASSGGMLTAILNYLLEERLIDGVIHSIKDETKPWRTVTVCTEQISDLLERSGSRYTQSSPLKDIFSLIEKNKKYAFVGKPCDVAVLKNYFETDPMLQNQIIYTFSFFCAGIPSELAEKRLIEKMGSSMDKVKDLNYRGNGWPGLTTIIEKEGKVLELEYEKSWGQVLGRDICKMCRFCMDGVGEFADISCGDAWYVENGKPDFSEHEGRNVVFARTKKGLQLLENVRNKGYVYIEEYPDIDEIKIYQKYQYERRATMFEKTLAMRICGREVPRYSLLKLKRIKSDVSMKKRWNIFKGTLKRIKNKTI